MQLWTIAYILPVAIVFIILLKLLRIRATDARRSLRYYFLTLVTVLVWMVLSAAMQYLPQDRVMEEELISRISPAVSSLAVLFFVASTIYFTRSPTIWEGLLISTPLLISVITSLFASFEVRFMSYWWLGQVSDPTLRYLATVPTVGVVLYGLLRLVWLRSKAVSKDAKRRLTFFTASLATALASALALYVFEQVLELPPLDTISAGLSLLISYPAFSVRVIGGQERSR